MDQNWSRLRGSYQLRSWTRGIICTILGAHLLLKLTLQYSSAIFPPPTTLVPYPEASNITVGDGFYGTVSHLPRGEYQLMRNMSFVHYIYTRHPCDMGGQHAR